MKNFELDKSHKKFTDNFEPILRGCQNLQCFCTGKCREVIGYRDKSKEERLAKSFFLRGRGFGLI